MLAIEATWVSGWVNCREYWMKAWMSPIVIAPADTCSPPITAMATKFRLPRNIIVGWMMPDTNCAPNPAWNSSSLVSANRASTSPCRPNALTRAWPVNASSTCALSMPVCRHWATKRGWERRAMAFVNTTDRGIVSRATSASSGEMMTIIVSTPTTVSSDVSSWLSVCWRLWATLSMSLVTRLKRSPRGCWST